jgi:hypothetical protein
VQSQLQRFHQQRADRDRGAARGVEGGQLGVVAEAAAGEVDQRELALDRELRGDQRGRIGDDELGRRAERAPACEGGAHDPPDVTVGLWSVADGVDELESRDEESSSLDDEEPESLDEESVLLDDEPVSLDDEPLDDESLDVVVVVVVSAVVLCEVLAQASPLSASAAAAVSATAHRRSACMRRRPWSRARLR